ncbi:hypothetical protein FRACYDRAFT_268400 [Fragilariopsis cylindrus CCMP1102]|uniref:Uncharacterized protein n=1 Tax=Fragilariopsis cylindrus CCMP1102 TaxID=635003 RepID=A0A1E7FKJ0_9STRA|nr:hypothetical protein FRACYDRAFT_268400 [Fragilariopsis cylindrus CCMP1102]|eukprot:OEU18681.1 hypothetical protein FRACYDRAFT_268400 [Fragilariopsis cylindrus CCMP1102]
MESSVFCKFEIEKLLMVSLSDNVFFFSTPSDFSTNLSRITDEKRISILSSVVRFALKDFGF